MNHIASAEKPSAPALLERGGQRRQAREGRGSGGSDDDDGGGGGNEGEESEDKESETWMTRAKGSLTARRGSRDEERRG